MYLYIHTIRIAKSECATKHSLYFYNLSVVVVVAVSGLNCESSVPAACRCAGLAARLFSLNELEFNLQ